MILPLSSILADFDYKFELFSFDHIYKEYLADRSKPELSLEVLYYAEGFPDRILQDDMERGFITALTMVMLSGRGSALIR